MELGELIAQQAADIAKAVQMPKADVVFFDEKKENTPPKKEFATKVFLIIDDISALEYSEFINQVFRSKGDMEVVREVENWTKEGELIRVVDYVFPSREGDDD